MKNYYELNVNTVFDYLQDKLNFFESSAKPVCKEIGDGNLNLVFHLVDESSGKSVIVNRHLHILGRRVKIGHSILGALKLRANFLNWSIS